MGLIRSGVCGSGGAKGTNGGSVAGDRLIGIEAPPGEPCGERGVEGEQSVQGVDGEPPEPSPAGSEPSGPASAEIVGTAGPRESVQWVADHIADLRTATDFPSPMAQGMYRTYRKNPGAFFERVYPVYCRPSKSEGDRDERMLDDNRKILAVLERVERAYTDAVHRGDVADPIAVV